MKVGGLTKLANTSFTTTVTANAGFAETNIVNEDTLKKWQVTEGTVVLTIDCDSFSANTIGIFNVTIEDDIEIKTINSSVVTTSTNSINVSELSGIDKKGYVLELGETITDIVQIILTTNGTTSNFDTSVGYIWAGDLTDWGCSESLQAFDLAADTATITRANLSQEKREYNTRRYNVGTNKLNTFDTLKVLVRDVLQNGGYAAKRPFLLDEPWFGGDGDMLLGIFDSGTFGYDMLETNEPYYAQIQVGIREVF